jgi:hypothetical protein
VSFIRSWIKGSASELSIENEIQWIGILKFWMEVCLDGETEWLCTRWIIKVWLRVIPRLVIQVEAKRQGKARQGKAKQSKRISQNGLQSFTLPIFQLRTILGWSRLMSVSWETCKRGAVCSIPTFCYRLSLVQPDFPCAFMCSIQHLQRPACAPLRCHTEGPEVPSFA